MNIKTELLKKYISDVINDRIEDFEIDADKITDSVAIKMLAEIQGIIKNDAYCIESPDNPGVFLYNQTEFVLFSFEGRIINRIVLGGSNPNMYGVDVAFSVFKKGDCGVCSFREQVYRWYMCRYCRMRFG